MADTAVAAHDAGIGEELKKRPYVFVFLALAIVTAIELYVSGLALAQFERISILVILATFKGSLVVAYYMHLRYEPRWLALIPLGGLALVIVLISALAGTTHAPVPTP